MPAKTAKSGKISKSASVPVSTRLPVWIPALAILSAYAIALVYARSQVPAGLNNDAAEEALRGIYLVEGRHFEAITFSIGNSAETLYLYLLGAMAHWLGPTTLAIQLPSWLAALACIWLVWKLVECITDRVPAWVPPLLAGCSLWLFHYARSGLRAICSPLFLALFAYLLERAERRPMDRMAGLLCGGVLGLGIYGYTSNRALVIAFVLYAAFRLARPPNDRAALIRIYATIALGALVASIPNLWFFLRQPREFLLRGSYVLRGGAGDWIVNTLWSALLPFYYPDVYRHIGGPGFYFDGVSAGLTSAGFNPVPIVFGIAFLFGLWRARQYLDRPVAVFLLAAFVAATLSLGIAGPSLTRFLILLPVYLVFAAIGIGFVLEKRPVLRIPVMLLILGVGVSNGYSYLSGGGEALEYYAAAATSIGETAANLAAQGQKVVCVLSRDAAVARYLTHGRGALVKVVEFYQRPPDAAQIPFDEFRPDVLLIEDTPQFRAFTARFPAQWLGSRGDRYYSARMPAK